MADTYREGKAKLNGNHYGYKTGTVVKVLEASNLPYKDGYWIQQGKWKDDNVGALLRADTDCEWIKYN